MYGFLLLLENLEVLNRYFEASKPIVYHFRKERTSLSTRLLRANDPFEGIFLPDR